MFDFRAKPYQLDFAFDCITKKRIVGVFCRQCLDGDTIIPLTNGGYKYLKDIKVGDKVFCLSPTYNIKEGFVKNKWVSGIQKTFKIKTCQNNEIIATANHKFYTKYVSHGVVKYSWRSINDGLSKRMWVASPNVLYGKKEKVLLNNDLMKFLGYMISDGSYSFGQSIKFTNNNSLFLCEVKDIVANNFKDVVIKEYKKNKGVDLVFTSGRKTFHSNSLREFFKDIGVLYQKRCLKTIPDIVLKSKNANLFLNRFFSGDGWISKNEIGVCSVSEKMNEQLVYLLNKYGCKSYVYEVKNTKNQKSRFWKIRIADKISLRNFFDNIGLIYGKQEKCIALIKKLNIKTKRKEQGILDGEIRWLRIKSIQYYGERETFDIEVKKYHNFVANNLITHNSGKTATTSRTAILIADKFPKSKILIFAPTERQTEHFGEFIKSSLSVMPYFSDFYPKRILNDRFQFSNGSEIRCLTSALGSEGETMRGLTGTHLIIEEAGSIPDSIIQNVILPMGATTDATIIKIGTPRGMNHFYESYKSNLYAVHCYDWRIAVKAGLISQTYIDEQKANMPDIQFRTEYGAEFIPDQDAFFSYELIENCIDDKLGFDGEQMQQGYVYYIGADIARLGQDSTVIMVIKVRNNIAELIRIIDYAKSTLDVVIDKLEELIAFYKPKRVFIDETGLGAGVTDVLAKKYNQPRFIEGKNMIGFPRQTLFADKIVGIKFTIQSKLDMYSNLKVIMQQGRLKYGRHPKLIAQLRDFRYELTENQNVKLHHSEYGFDDYCDALALVCKEVNVKSIAYSLGV